VPIIVLSAAQRRNGRRSRRSTRRDDYVAKPFASGELTARLRAALPACVSGARAIAVFSSGDLSVDLVRRHVTRRWPRDQTVAKEFRVYCDIS